MNEIDVYLSEIKLALKKCKEADYSAATVRVALELLGELCRIVPQEAQQGLLGEMERLVEKHKAAAKRARETRERGWTDEGEETLSLDEYFPVKAPSAIEDGIRNFSVLESQQGCYDNAYLVYGPFEEELKFQAEGYAKARNMPVRYIDCAKLSREYRPLATKLLSELCKRLDGGEKELILYYSLPALKGDETLEQAVCYYLKKMRAERKNATQLLLSSEPSYPFEGVYKKWMETFYPDDDPLDALYYGSLTFLFFPLPKFDFVKAQILKKSGVETFSEEDEKLLKKEGAHLGYKGVNALASENAWQDTVHSYASKERKAALDAFIKEVGDTALVLDEEWGYRRKREKATYAPVLTPIYELPRSAYDGVAGIDEIRARLEKILNYEGVSVLLKCGWAVNYALDNGDSWNVFNLDKDALASELTKRWELAYDALSALMQIPRGELIFDIKSGDTTLGQCCDGGKTIRMQKAYVTTNDPDKINEGKATLLHETFHALQHTAIQAWTEKDEEKLAYYAAHFHVNSHIQEWQANFSRYRASDCEGKYHDYYDQIVEAEARIFAADRLAEFSSFSVPKFD